MNIETRIKEIREAKRIKLAEVAAVLEIDVSNYSKLEKRGSKLSIEQLEKIAIALDVTLIDLFSDTSQSIEPSQRERELIKQNEEFRKRIDGLEDALKDKDLINNHLSEKIAICEEYLLEILENLFNDIALGDKRYGTFVYSRNNNVFKITNKDLEKLSDDERERIYSQNIAFEFSEDEVEETMKAIFTDEAYKKLSSLIMWTGMIKDERFIKYFKKHIVHTNPSVKQMKSRINSENNSLEIKNYHSGTGFELDS